MRKIREVLRLQAAGLKGREIAEAIGSALSTVQSTAIPTGIVWNDDRLGSESPTGITGIRSYVRKPGLRVCPIVAGRSPIALSSTAKVPGHLLRGLMS